MTKKVIVIGSGFGGLASALRLRAKGYEVTLVEKHPDLGGRARVFKRGNFVYDGGPTVITAPYLIEELFSLFNKKISDYVKIVPLDLWYRFVFSDGETFDYSGNEKSMEKEIKKLNFNDPKIPIVSNVTANITKDNLEYSELMIKQIEHRVRWRESIQFMAKNNVKKFVEIGPGKVLSNLIKRIDTNFETLNINSIDHLEEFKL